MIPFPNQTYTVIYADPPWEYDDEARAGNRGAVCKYDVMDADAISELPIAEIAAKDAALFMWMTMPKMMEAWNVVRGWGFTFKTVAFTWLKRTDAGKLHWGMGRWTRANPELCWLATRGKPHRVDAGVHSVVLEAPVAEHSEKPNEVRERIVELMGDVPRIELFARKRYHGWDAWGNQVNEYFEEDVTPALWP